MSVYPHAFWHFSSSYFFRGHSYRFISPSFLKKRYSKIFGSVFKGGVVAYGMMSIVRQEKSNQTNSLNELTRSLPLFNRDVNDDLNHDSLLSDSTLWGFDSLNSTERNEIEAKRIKFYFNKIEWTEKAIASKDYDRAVPECRFLCKSYIFDKEEDLRDKGKKRAHQIANKDCSIEYLAALYGFERWGDCLKKCAKGKKTLRNSPFLISADQNEKDLKKLYLKEAIQAYHFGIFYLMLYPDLYKNAPLRDLSYCFKQSMTLDEWKIGKHAANSMVWMNRLVDKGQEASDLLPKMKKDEADCVIL